jgi:hypothetical protein
LSDNWRRSLQLAGIAWLAAAALTLLSEPVFMARTAFGVSYAALGLYLIARPRYQGIGLSAIGVLASAFSLVSEPAIGSPPGLVACVVAAAFTVVSYDVANRAERWESGP